METVFLRMFVLITAVSLISPLGVKAGFETDQIDTDAGKLEITFVGHGTLMFRFQNTVIHADPWTRLADYSTMPKADIIVITHEHTDHLDPEAIRILRKDDTEIVMTQPCADQIRDGKVMKNRDVMTFKGIKIEAVPAYNLVHTRKDGTPFHPKGKGNGYILTVGNRRIYVAGDTENIPEMKELGNIDVAFLPMNMPYTMTPEMTADAARVCKPRILYPYHFGDTDTSRLVNLLKNDAVEVRIRNMK